MNSGIRKIREAERKIRNEIRVQEKVIPVRPTYSYPDHVVADDEREEDLMTFYEEHCPDKGWRPQFDADGDDD